MSSLLTMNPIQVFCSKSTVNYQLKTLEIVKFVTFLSRNDNMLVHMCSLRRLLLTTTRRVPPPRNCVLSVRNNENVGPIHSTKIQTGPTGKSGLLQKVDQFFFETFPAGPNRSIEFWTEISGNFGWMDCALDWVPLGPDVWPAYCAEENSSGLIFAQYKFIINN